MVIVIFGDNFSFPEGDAGTNRVYTYANGFVENNVNTYVICFKNNYLINGNGVLNGIQYFNPLNQSERNSHFFIRNGYKVLKYFNTIKLIKSINKKEKIDAIITDTQLGLTYLFSYYLAKKHRAKLIFEKSEHPLRLYQSNALKKIQGLIKHKIESHLCDGIICISRFLFDFFRNSGVPRQKLFMIPSTVDPARFKQTEENPLRIRYIGYFGGLTFKRDNIDGIIRAFVLISNKYPDLHLVLGGFCSENERIKIINMISDLGMSSKIILLKYLPRKEIIKYIINSEILVMVRGKDMESDASFPSKLTEYLATGIPVVTVNVGEISDYLTDGVNSFLVEPENSHALAEKINYVLNHYDSALEVASKGKELTSGVFNYRYQAGKIIDLINSISN